METYTNAIHVDPCCPLVRTVTSRGNARASDNICISGMVTKAVCGYELIAWQQGEWQRWDVSKLQQAYKYAATTQSGDSGAPWYVRTSSTAAKIVGLHVGVNHQLSPVSWKISVIESATGGSVTTSCCADSSW